MNFEGKNINEKKDEEEDVNQEQPENAQKEIERLNEIYQRELKRLEEMKANQETINALTEAHKGKLKVLMKDATKKIEGENL